jgi:hypothetical protein
MPSKKPNSWIKFLQSYTKKQQKTNKNYTYKNAIGDKNAKIMYKKMKGGGDFIEKKEGGGGEEENTMTEGGENKTMTEGGEDKTMTEGGENKTEEKNKSFSFFGGKKNKSLKKKSSRNAKNKSNKGKK